MHLVNKSIVLWQKKKLLLFCVRSATVWKIEFNGIKIYVSKIFMFNFNKRKYSLKLKKKKLIF